MVEILPAAIADSIATLVSHSELSSEHYEPSSEHSEPSSEHSESSSVHNEASSVHNETNSVRSEENLLTEYSWWGNDNSPPDNLKTKSQLAKLGLVPVSPVAIIPTRKYDCKLYDVNNSESVRPKKPCTEKQLDNLARGRKLQEIKRWLRDNGDRMMDENACVNWANEVLKNPDKYVILDTETTGLSRDSEVVQIGIVDLDGKVLFDSLVKPSIPIPESASNIHHITDEMVKDAPAFGTIYHLIKAHLEGKEVIIYNASYDTRILAYCCKRIELPHLALKSRSHCAMEWYSQFVGEWNDYYGDYRWQRLPSGDHSAVGDCLAVIKVIKEMAESPLHSLNPEDYLENV